MKKNTKGLIYSSALVFFLVGSILASANLESEVDESFVEETITITPEMYTIQDLDLSDYISIEGFGRLLIPGKPNLPSKIFALAIPPEAVYTHLEYTLGKEIILSEPYDIAPSPLPRVIGEEDPLLYEQKLQIYKNNLDTTYSTDRPYPSSVVEFMQTARYHHYNLVDVRVTPLSYKPLSKELIYYPEITISLSYKIPQGSIRPTTETLSSTENVAEKIIYNYQQAQEWYITETPKRGGLYDYVIITLDSLTSAVTPLVDWETYKERTVEVVTTSWINANYNGYDLAEKMRNFLREKYPAEEWGIKDVLLVGDYNDLPMRRTWQDLGYGKPETDFYYAELSFPDNQSWDADGDHRWGEDSDPVDYYSEVTIGRIPWSDPTTVEHICEKSVNYELNNDPSFKKNILLLGAFFWDDDPNPRTDNAVLMEYKINSDLHPWMLDWTMTRLYEMGYSTYPMDYDLTNYNVVNVWSSGTFSFVNWAGHGSPTACYRYHPSTPFIELSDCPQLNDDYPAIIFADACSNSDTDYMNIGQAMLKQGGVGFIGATKVALGCPGWTNPYSGSSQSMDYFFTTSVTSGEYTQGEAHQFALQEMYVNGLWNDNKYEMFEWSSLWGNPDLGMAEIAGSIPQPPQQPEGETHGERYLDYEYSTVTIDPESNPVYYLWDWGDGTESDWAGPFESGEVVSASHNWSDEGEYLVCVKAKNDLGGISGWSDSLTVAIEDLSCVEIGAISGIFGINVYIKNTGEADAYNVYWRISLDGNFLFYGDTISDTQDVIAANDKIRVETGFVFGLGTVDISVRVNDLTKTAKGFILGPFVLVLG